MKGDDPAAPEVEAVAESEIFYVVEEMPTFQWRRTHRIQKLHCTKSDVSSGGYRKRSIAERSLSNLSSDKDGKVVIPDQKTLAQGEGKPLDEVVVVGSYRTLEEDAETPDEKYIQMLKDEAIRVISGSPDWTPGKQRGKNVNVMFTFPINFALQ